MKRARIAFGIVIALLWSTIETVRAQQDYAAVLSSNITADTIVSELSMGGETATFESAKSPGVQLGQITVTKNGAKIILFLARCPNDSGEKVCVVGFNVLLQDSKNLLTDKVLAAMNGAMLYAKATKIDRPGQPLLRIVYSYYCGGLDSPKAVVALLEAFRLDVAKGISIYVAG